MHGTRNGFLTLGLLLAWLAAPVFAATYYVDGQHGDDTQDGLSPATAWRSLDRVNRLACRPGDRILFRAGTVFQGQLKPSGSGALRDGKPDPVVIGAYGDGPRPRLDGQGVMPATLCLDNVEYWEVNDLEITNHGNQRAAGRSGVFVHLEDFGTAHHIYLNHLFVHDVNGSLVKKQGGGSGIHWRNEGSRRWSRFDGLRIENCHLVRCERNGIVGGSAYWKRSNWYPSLHVVIRNNLLEEIPGDGIVPIGCDGAVVEYNVMRDSPRILPATEAAAGIWPWSSDNTVIQFNEVSGHRAPTDAQGFDSDWNCRHTLIQYNYSHDNDGGFLLICDPGNVGMPLNIGNIGTVVRYNVSINDGLRTTGKHAGFSPTFHISGPVKQTRIYNNTIYIGRKPAPNVDRRLLKMNNWGGSWPEDTRFSNNIFYAEESTRYDYGQALATVFRDNFYGGDHDNAPNDPQALHGDPLFVHPGLPPAGIRALLGYRLQPGSPCIGAGLVLPDNGGRDFLGVPLPVNRPPSLGALEAPPGNSPRGASRRRPGWSR